MLQVNASLAAKGAPGNDAVLPAAQPDGVPAMGRVDVGRDTPDTADTRDAKGAKGKAASAGDGADAAVLPGDAFGAQLALQADAAQDPTPKQDLAGDAAQDAAPPSTDTAQATQTTQADPAQAAVPNAEQWLASMLGQREVTLQARDAAPTGASAAADQVGMAGLPQWRAALPAVQAQPQAGQPLPAQPLASPSLPVMPASSASPASKGVSASAAAAPGKAEPAFAEQLRNSLDKLASTTTEPAAPTPQATAANVPAPPPATAPAALPERQLTLQAPTERWGEQMLDALRDNVQLQLRQNLQSASIRLDPPELGRLEIHLSQDASRLTVQIHAAQGDVARMLQQGVERLRQDIAGTTLQPVEVQVSDGRGGQSGSQQQAQQGRPAPWLDGAPVRAAATEERTPPDAERRPRDVLVTV